MRTVDLRYFSSCVSFRQPAEARQAEAGYHHRSECEPTPLTHEGVSNYLIKEKTGEILPKIVEEIKKLR